MSQRISTWKGVFLFASTIVGAGILALPVIASKAGFLPLAAMIVVLAGVASLSGLYIAESVLADSTDSHLPALAQRHLGTWGVIAMLLGISIYVYGALIGYLVAGGQIFHTLSRGVIPVWCGTLIYFAAFQHHIGMYPITASLKEALAAELAPHLAPGRKNTAHFRHDKPLPLRLIARMVKIRRVENLARATKGPRSRRTG